jgi:hypothetical protein
MTELLEHHGEPDTKTGERKLRQIPIRLLSDDMDDVLQARWAWYGKKDCGAWTDGEKVVWYYDPKDNYKPLNPPREEPFTKDVLEMTDNQGRKYFKLHARFHCVIATKTAKFGGVYTFRTTSIISFKQMYAGLTHIASLTNGILVGVPLWMVLRPMNVQPEIKPGERHTSTVYVVHIEARGEDLQAIQTQAIEQARYRMEFREQAQAMQAKYRKMLTYDESHDEQRYTAMEYSPEFQDDETPEVVVAPRSVQQFKEQFRKPEPEVVDEEPEETVIVDEPEPSNRPCTCHDVMGKCVQAILLSNDPAEVKKLQTSTMGQIVSMKEPEDELERAIAQLRDVAQNRLNELTKGNQ